MNTQQIKQIENCFNPHHICDLSNLSIPTIEEEIAFEQMLAEYKQESHVILYSQTFQERWEAEHNGCPF